MPYELIYDRLSEGSQQQGRGHLAEKFMASGTFSPQTIVARLRPICTAASQILGGGKARSRDDAARDGGGEDENGVICSGKCRCTPFNGGEADATN